jgi:hypothetical protein
MLTEPQESRKGSYVQESRDTVQLAAGKELADRLGSGTIGVTSTSLSQSAYVKDVNGTLVSVGQLWDQCFIVGFCMQEDIVLNTATFTTDPEVSQLVVPRCADGLYCCEKFEQKYTEASKHTKYSSVRMDSITTELVILHRRLVHFDVNAIKASHRHAPMFTKLTGKLSFCHSCGLEKAITKQFTSHLQQVSFAGLKILSQPSARMARGVGSALSKRRKRAIQLGKGKSDCIRVGLGSREEFKV